MSDLATVLLFAVYLLVGSDTSAAARGAQAYVLAPHTSLFLRSGAVRSRRRLRDPPGRGHDGSSRRGGARRAGRRERRHADEGCAQGPARQEGGGEQSYPGVHQGEGECLILRRRRDRRRPRRHRTQALARLCHPRLLAKLCPRHRDGLRSGPSNARRLARPRLQPRPRARRVSRPRRGARTRGQRARAVPVWKDARLVAGRDPLLTDGVGRAVGHHRHGAGSADHRCPPDQARAHRLAHDEVPRRRPRRLLKVAHLRRDRARRRGQREAG
mmetsp:Transcript_23782/g.76274  ORF Transcript_23782/g.76274 Transcript_23782/m.76274 type:complete len:271 (+) Transcript_23782:817-1629(+)